MGVISGLFLELWAGWCYLGRGDRKRKEPMTKPWALPTTWGLAGEEYAKEHEKAWSVNEIGRNPE